MSLQETLDNLIVRVWHNGMQCMSTANVSDYDVKGVQAFIDKDTHKCVIDIDIRRLKDATETK